MEYQKVKLPEVLYHYCGPDQFKSIIENKCLWATNIFHFEDRQEHQWLKKVIQDRIRERDPDRESRLLSRLTDTLSERELSHLYCACFSKEGDMLSQWRAYADDCRGFAIGFSLAHLEKIREANRKESIRTDIVPVIYDRKSQIEIADPLIDFLVSFDQNQDHISDVMDALSIWFKAPECKNPDSRQVEPTLCLVENLTIGGRHDLVGADEIRRENKSINNARSPKPVSFKGITVLMDIRLSSSKPAGVRSGTTRDTKFQRQVSQIHCGYQRSSYLPRTTSAVAADARQNGRTGWRLTVQLVWLIIEAVRVPNFWTT